MRTEPAGDRAIAGLSPSNFAIVMATGIVGLAAHQQAHATIAAVLLVLTGLAWVAIAALTAARLVLHPGRMLADLRSHQRAPGFLTAVAATAVLGSQLLVQEAWPAAAGWLAAVAAVLWIGLTYCILLSLIIARDKPLLPAGISGSWLLTVVSTQSLAVLGALLAAHAAQPLRLYLNFAAMACWLCGGMVYVWVISLIFYRYAFFPF
ncbi:MAG: C4-dicarboxylate transporter, partial [Ramlibacter sp.]|nr:C4-dicarboxylate transporter [Ramlibacter sp.]